MMQILEKGEKKEMEEKKEKKEITLIKRTGKKKDGTQFDAFKMVKENGKLIDAHFRKDCNMKIFADGTKFKCKVGYLQITENYEFPRVYIGEIDETSVKKIY